MYVCNKKKIYKYFDIFEYVIRDVCDYCSIVFYCMVICS